MVEATELLSRIIAATNAALASAKSPAICVEAALVQPGQGGDNFLRVTIEGADELRIFVGDYLAATGWPDVDVVVD